MVLASTIFKSILTRLIFATHAMVTIYWLTIITAKEELWQLSWILTGLFLETLVSLFYRHGDEYKWVSPCIIFYLAATIPCAWILELHLLHTRISGTHGNTGAENATTTTPLDFPVSRENVTELVEQTTLLMMILGRWLLPKGSLTRESLSQLLLVNLAMSADIIEFFDILKLPTVRQSKELKLAILSLWTISLLQFPVNATAKLGSEEVDKTTQESPQSVQNTQNIPQATQPARASIPNYIKRHTRKVSRVSVDLSIRQAPLSDRKLSVIDPQQRRPSQLYTEDPESGDVLAYLPTNQRSRGQNHRQSIATERVRFPDVASRGNPRMSVDVGSFRANQNPRRASRDSNASNYSRGHSLADIGGTIAEKFGRSRMERGMSQDSNTTGTSEEGVPKHRVTMDLIGTLMSLFMQDGPFLTFRLYMIAQHNAIEYMIVFLTVKNALLLTLQVYKLCVMHCICQDHKDNDFSPENQVDAMSRLNNVQIAVVHEETEASTSGNDRSRRMRSRYDRLSVRWSRTNANIRDPLFYSRAFHDSKREEH